jgi:glycosyltransferase involved in cell wall biosynthesis
MLVATKHDSDDSVLVLPRSLIDKGISRISARFEHQILIGHRAANTGKFSAGIHRRVNQRALLERIEEVRPDVVHLHWIAGGFLLPQTLTSLRYPLVWTVRDFWPLTGGCHYPVAHCVSYQTGCSSCPMFEQPWLAKVPGHLLQRKRQLWTDLPLTLVAISNWVAACVRRSIMFRDKPIETISNAIDPTVFSPVPKETARHSLGLPKDQPIILFGAVNGAKDLRKGFQFIRSGLEQGLLCGREIPKRPHLVTFGFDEALSLPITGIDHTNLGVITNDATLRLAYSAADVTVMPSIQETFGKVAIESMACGTPVASFDTSGLRDIVRHKVNGYRAKCFDVQDLFFGIRSILKDRGGREALAAAARHDVLQHFSMERQVELHLRLYERLLM